MTNIYKIKTSINSGVFKENKTQVYLHKDKTTFMLQSMNCDVLAWQENPNIV